MWINQARTYVIGYNVKVGDHLNIPGLGGRPLRTASVLQDGADWVVQPRRFRKNNLVMNLIFNVFAFAQCK